MDPLQFGLVTGVVMVGATLQGSVGFGLGLLSVPLLLLIAPELIPGPLLSSSVVLTVLLAHREWHAVQFADLKWALGGRLVGVGAAMAALVLAPTDWIGTGFGVLVLLAVLVSASGVHIAPGPKTLIGAGMLSGLMGTLISIGGPAIALLYQRESGPRIRGTLSAYFVVGVVLSTIGLHLVGRYGLYELRLAGALVPGILAGFLLSRLTSRVLDGGYTRIAVLVVSAATAIAVILRG